MCSMNKAMRNESIEAKITKTDFSEALDKVFPSVSTKDRHVYEDVSEIMTHYSPLLAAKKSEKI